MHRSLLLSTALLLAAGPAAAIERWVDERGGVHYGERAPLGSVGEPLTIDATAAPEPTAATVPPHSVTPLPAGTIVEGELASDSSHQVAQCSQARENLVLFRDGRRLRLRDPVSGEFRFLSDAERAAELARAERQQRHYCVTE